MRRTREAAAQIVFSQLGRFLLWVPVLFGAGITAYFALRFEPGAGAVALLAAMGLAGALAVARGGDAGRVLGWVPILLAAGFATAMLRAHSVAAPRLEARIHGPVEGRVVALDRSASERPRVTLAEPVIAGLAPEETPARVRVSLHGAVEGAALTPGARLMMTAHLGPPGGPVEPGGFDFQRKAWFERLGGVGYTRAPPVLAAPPPEGSWRGWVFAQRMALARALKARLPGEAGGFAAAILVGERTGIEPDRLEDLRGANLAHLLAISGLHMGLLTGFVFAAVRVSIAAVPGLGLRVDARKIAAVVALLAGAAYLALSGASVATQRAFVMVCVMLLAILVDRSAITLRAVAIAATLVLLVRPESLMEPGFQMSFAATVALVAAFEALNGALGWHALRATRLGWLARGPGALLVSSFVAAAATAPLSAFHFNQLAQYGLAANLLGVPLMGFLVMPAAVLAGVLAPLGLEGPALWAMGKGIEGILAVAHAVASLEGAVVHVPKGPPLALALVMLGGLFLVLWQGRARWFGPALAAAGVALWAGHARPVALVAGEGGLVGILTPEGRMLNKARGASFAAGSWLENDGDIAEQAVAAARAGGAGPPALVALGDVAIAEDDARRITSARLARLCASADLVLLPRARAPGGRSCRIVDAGDLAELGAAAIRREGRGRLQVLHVRDLRGHRLWSR